MDLDDAERWARGYAAKPEKERHREVGALLAELTRLRAALADAHAEIARLRAAVATLLAWCDETDAQNPIDQHRTLHTRIIRRRISEHVDLRALAVAPAPAGEA